jgi:hypothetical protein
LHMAVIGSQGRTTTAQNQSFCKHAPEILYLCSRVLTL